MSSHLTVEREVVTQFDRVTCTETWQGSYAECKAVQKQHLPGRSDSCQDIIDVWPSDVRPSPGVFCASARTVRRPGGGGICTIVYQALFNATIIGLDLAELSKPIKSWKADDATDAPNLDHIRQWEEKKEDDYTSYAAYKYDGTNVMAGNTKKLAEMIYSGIESYSEYVPIITMTYSYYYFPNGEPDVGANLGKQVTPTMPNGCTSVSGAVSLPTGIKSKWVNTGDRAATNNDGTITRVQQWSGFDKVNENLYPPPGGNNH